jgi:hypothetical protein
VFQRLDPGGKNLILIGIRAEFTHVPIVVHALTKGTNGLSILSHDLVPK